MDWVACEEEEEVTAENSLFYGLYKMAHTWSEVVEVHGCGDDNLGHSTVEIGTWEVLRCCLEKDMWVW